MTTPNTQAPGSRAETSGKQSGGTARDQIRDVKNQVVDQAKNTFQQARDRASSSLGESKNQFADQFGTMADALRRPAGSALAESGTFLAADGRIAMKKGCTP